MREKVTLILAFISWEGMAQILFFPLGKEQLI